MPKGPCQALSALFHNPGRSTAEQLCRDAAILYSHAALLADLGSNFRNIVQSVHHVIQQLELIFAQAAEVEGPRRTAGLDDTGNVLQTISPFNILVRCNLFVKMGAVNSLGWVAMMLGQARAQEMTPAA